jgi:exo-beta-1,3-glucanase (GH17 family)
MKVVKLTVLLLAANITSLTYSCSASATDWETTVRQVVWVTYAPTTANPVQRIEPTVESMQKDLAVLRRAGFTGLVTYSCSGLQGQKLPELAQQQDFEGLILGIWNPASQKEIAAAIAASGNPFVLGYCVGNEGLPDRYKMEQLSAVIQSLRTLTGKPVSTTEQIEDYDDKALLELGDWVFPNVHPYFHRKLDPATAVEWTRQAYNNLKKRTDRFILFKEVGLPTAGDPQTSETAQEMYYLALKKTDVPFVYFEAFDQSWKTHLPIEPHWGIFRSDRTPKLLGKRLLPQGPRQTTDEFFYVYLDGESRKKNHFVPGGYMGDCGDIKIEEGCKENPHSGQTCIRVTYSAKGEGPHKCDYPPPCKWAGVYWQQPADNWGTDRKWEGKGFNLSPYRRLTFRARADKDCSIEFKVGGINERYGDSLKSPRDITAKLSMDWKVFEIDLKGANLKHIIGGFCLATNWDTNPDGAIFYLDDIRFEKK